MKPKTPTQRIYDLRVKLEALVERGVNGERDAAKVKLDRLLKRYDFTKPYVRVEDIFAGKFKAASEAVFVWTFEPEDRDIANATKWAIEQSTKIAAVFRGDTLCLCAAPSSAMRLGKVVGTLAESFKRLWWQFAAAPGVNRADRGLFIRGLWDGCMLEEKPADEPLPARPGHVRKVKASRKALGHVAGINLHPYSVAVTLGKQIRFSASLETLSGELEATIKGALADEKE